MRALREYCYNLQDKIEDDNRSLLIIDREIRVVKTEAKIANRKWYKYKCCKCGNEHWASEYSLKNSKQGCNACCASPQKVVVGINDIATTDNWMVPYFKDPNDAYIYNKSSSKYADFVCPYCGRTRSMSIQNFYKRRYVPCICSDGVSFPNKFMYSLLSQLDLNFEIEKRFDWSENRVYDDYIVYNGIEIITEQHGKQHYDKRFCKEHCRTLEEEKANDLYKKRMALSNGIDYYLVIDSRQSTKDYIKKSIVESGLLTILDAVEDDIDWDECARFALSNIAKEVCDFKNKNPNIKLSAIAAMFKLDRTTIYNYIKMGNQIGWCSYEPSSDRRLPLRKNQKPIYCETQDIYFDCARTASNYLNLNDVMIKRSINRLNLYRKMKFTYISQEQFNKIKTESPDKAIGDFFII